VQAVPSTLTAQKGWIIWRGESDSERASVGVTPQQPGEIVGVAAAAATLDLSAAIPSCRGGRVRERIAALCFRVQRFLLLPRPLVWSGAGAGFGPALVEQQNWSLCFEEAEMPQDGSSSQ
jgi:hypothetical protein